MSAQHIRHRFIFILLLLRASLFADHYTIGVTNFGSVHSTLEEWAPVVALLNSASATTQFSLKLVSFADIIDSVKSHKIDFVCTSSQETIFLNRTYGLSKPLLSLQRGNDSLSIDAIGGTIFTLASNSGINKIEDLRNVKIATPRFGSFIPF